MAPRKARKIRVPTESHLPGRLAGTPSESQSTSVSAKRLAPTGEPLPASPSALCQLGHLKWSWTRGRGLEARQGRVWGGEIRRADMPSCIYANLAAGGERRKSPRRHPGTGSGPKAGEARRQRLLVSGQPTRGRSGCWQRAQRCVPGRHTPSQGAQPSPHRLRGGLIWRALLELFTGQGWLGKVSPKLRTYHCFPGESAC